jgi:hypothetical protein
MLVQEITPWCTYTLMQGLRKAAQDYPSTGVLSSAQRATRDQKNFDAISKGFGAIKTRRII